MDTRLPSALAYFGSFIALGLAQPALALGETMYVTDLLRLGIHQASDTSDRPFRTLVSGTRVEVLERSTNYALVRLDDGRQGWLKAAYLVADKPARLRLTEIEAEYGQTIEAYEGVLTRGGREITVDYLHIGRVALYYIMLDRSEAGIWDQSKRAWVVLPQSMLDDLDYALRVARKQAPPDLMPLPLWTPGR